MDACLSVPMASPSLKKSLVYELRDTVSPMLYHFYVRFGIFAMPVRSLSSFSRPESPSQVASLTLLVPQELVSNERNALRGYNKTPTPRRIRISENPPSISFRFRTYTSVSKQRTLSDLISFRFSTYKKTRGRGYYC